MADHRQGEHPLSPEATGEKADFAAVHGKADDEEDKGSAHDTVELAEIRENSLS